MEQTKKLNMTSMSEKTNSNTTAKKEEPAWEHKVAMKVSGVSIAVNLSVFREIVSCRGMPRATLIALERCFDCD